MTFFPHITQILMICFSYLNFYGFLSKFKVYSSTHCYVKKKSHIVATQQCCKRKFQQIMKRPNIKYMYFTIFVFFSAYSIKFVKPGFIENILSKKTWHNIL